MYFLPLVYTIFYCLKNIQIYLLILSIDTNYLRKALKTVISTSYNRFYPWIFPKRVIKTDEKLIFEDVFLDNFKCKCLFEK